MYQKTHPIPAELVNKIVGNGVACSPIVTVEPRRRKFHKAITLQMPLPVAGNKGMINEYKQADSPTLRLLFSLTGGSNKAVWEDLTGSTQLSLVNNCVSFTTTVSARFWLIDCRQIAESSNFANLIYQKAIEVPFLVKFIIYAKQVSLDEYELRTFILTDDKEEKTLEQLENYVEIAKSKLVEINQYSTCYLEFAGNFKPIANTSEQLQLKFEAFKENRLPCRIKIKDLDAEIVGRVAFMREKRRQRTDLPQTPICNLNIILPFDPTLPEEEPPKPSPIKRDSSPIKLNGYSSTNELSTSPLSRKQLESPHKQSFKQDAELHPTLVKVSNQLDKDWTKLALHLNVPEQLVDQLANEPDLSNQERAAHLLQYWQNNLNANPKNPSENVLENALRRIDREDIIYKAIFNINQIEDQIKRPELQQPLYADINRHEAKASTYQPFEIEDLLMEQEPEQQQEETAQIRYEDDNRFDSNRYEQSPQIIELTEGYTIEQQQPTDDLLADQRQESPYEYYGQENVQPEYETTRIEEDLLGERIGESTDDFVLEETVVPQQQATSDYQSSISQPKSKQELPESIVESQETIEDTDQGVIHTVKQSTKTIIRSETEEPSSSLIQFEPQDSNEMNVDQDPEIISSSYYQKADNENDDLKINVQQKENECYTLLPADLWFESNVKTEESCNTLGVQLNGKKKALSDRNLDSINSDETFIFSSDFIKQLKEEFSSTIDAEKEWIEEDDDGTTHHIIEQKTVCKTVDSTEDLVSYTEKKDYFQQLSKDSKTLPVPRSWSADEQTLTDDQTKTKSSKRSLSTSATLSENEQEKLIKQSVPEHSSELSDQQNNLKEQRRSSVNEAVIEEIPEFKERVEYFRRMSKEESIEDSAQLSSNSSSQFTPNTAKRIAGQIVSEVQKRAIEQITSNQESGHKMSKTTETQKDSQEEDVDSSVSAHWYSSDSIQSDKNHSKSTKQDVKVYDLSKLEELSHKIKRARYSDDESVDSNKLEAQSSAESKEVQQSPKSIQNLLRSQSLESSKQQSSPETNRKLSLKDTKDASNLETTAQTRTWFKPPIPSTSKSKILPATRKNESIEEIKENMEKNRQYRSASLGKEGIFQCTQKSLSSSLQALVSGKLNESSFNTLERALNIIRAYDLQQLEPDNSIYELLDSIDDQDFKKAVQLANAFLDDEYKKLISSVDLLDEDLIDSELINEDQTDLEKNNLQVPGSDKKEIKKQSSFEKQQLELQQLEESVDIDELIDLIPDEQSILSKNFRESDLVLLRKLRSIEEDDSPENDQNKESTHSLSDKLTVDFNNNFTSFELSDYPESLKLDLSSRSDLNFQLSKSDLKEQLSRSDLNERLSKSPEQQPKLQFKQNVSVQTEKSFLLTQRMHTINAIVKEITRPEFIEDALCSSPTESLFSDSPSQKCTCSECTSLLANQQSNNENGSPPKNDNISLQSYETCPSLLTTTSCSEEWCKRRQSLQSEMYFTCSEGSVSRCSTCSSLTSLENKMMVDQNINDPNQQRVHSSGSECDRPVSTCESSSTITSRSTLDSVEAAQAAVETGLIALIAGELTLLLGELTLKFEISKRLDKEYESNTTSDSDAAKQSINDQYEQMIREHLAPIYEIYGKELPDNCMNQLIGDYKNDGSYVISEKDIQPEQLALRTQDMLRKALPIKQKSKKSSKKLSPIHPFSPPDLFSTEESEGVWVQTYTSTSSTDKKQIETQTSEEDFSEDNSDSLFGKYLLMDNDKILSKKPLLLDVDEFINYLIDYCIDANSDEDKKLSFKPNLNVRDVVINLRRNKKFIYFLDRINGQLKANANNEVITNHDLLLEMVTDQCKDELIGILKDVISSNIIRESDLDYGDFDPVLLDSIPEEDPDELLSRGSTLNAKTISLYKEQQINKWLAASLDNLAVYAQQQNALTTAKITDSEVTLLPTSKEELDKAILEKEKSLKQLIEDEFKDKIETAAEKVSMVKMPIYSEEVIRISEDLRNADNFEDNENKDNESLIFSDSKPINSNQMDHKIADLFQDDQQKTFLISEIDQKMILTESKPEESTKADQQMILTESEPTKVSDIDQKMILTEFEPLKVSEIDQQMVLTETKPKESTKADQQMSLTESEPTKVSDVDEQMILTESPDLVSLSEIVLRKKSKEEPTSSKNRTSLEVPNTFTRLALSLDEGSDDEESEMNTKKLEKTHSLPEDEFSRKALNNFVESKNQRDPHITNLDLSQIENNESLMHEEVLNLFLKNQKRPKLQYQFASEEDLIEDAEFNKNLDDSFDQDDTNLDCDSQLQDSIFENLNLMETIEESFEDDSVNNLIQNQEQMILSQQMQIDDLQQQLIDQQAEQENLMSDHDQLQQEMFDNELMELKKEYENIYSNQEQYFDNLQRINQADLEAKLEILLNQASQTNLPNEQEFIQNQDDFNQLQDLVEKLTNLPNPSQKDQRGSINKVDTLKNQNKEILNNQFETQQVDDQKIPNQVTKNQVKLTQKSFSDSLSEDKEKSTSSDASVITEILNESFPNLKHEPLESSIKSDNVLTSKNIKFQEIDETQNSGKNELQNLDNNKVQNLGKNEVQYYDEDELEEIDLNDNQIFEKAQSIDLDDNLEMIENIASTLENLVTEAKPPSGKQKSLSQTKFIKPSLMEEIAKTLNELLTEAKNVLGDNQITLSSQKLNSKQDVIKSITNTLENLLIIDESDQTKQFSINKKLRKNLIQNITKSLENLLTEDQQPKSFQFKQQRSFDQEPKLNLIITRSLENLLTLSNLEFSPTFKKAKKPSVIESITRTLENLFTKSQIEMDEQSQLEQCSCQIVLDNKKSEYKSIPIKSTEIVLKNKKSEYRSVPIESTEIVLKNKKSEYSSIPIESIEITLDNKKFEYSSIPIESIEIRLDNKKSEYKSVPIESTEIVLKNKKSEYSSIPIESIEITLDNKKSEYSSIPIESIEITLDNKKSEYKSIPVKSSEIVLKNEKSEYKSVPIESSEIVLKNKKSEYSSIPVNQTTQIFLNNSKSEYKIVELDENLLDNKDDKISSKSEDQKPVAPKRTKKLKIGKDQDSLSQKSFENTSLVTVMSPDVVEEKRILLPELQADVEMIEKIKEPEPTDFKFKHADKKRIENDKEPQKIEQINDDFEKLDTKDDSIKFKTRQKISPNEEIIVNLEPSKTDHTQISDLDAYEKQKSLSESKTSDLIKTDYIENNKLKPKEIPKDPSQNIVSVVKSTDLVKTDYYKPDEQLKEEENIELEKIEDDKKKQAKHPKLKLRMPLSRKESVLIRQNQIDEEENQIPETSGSFEIKLISDDQEDLSPDSLVIAKKKSVDKSNQKIDEQSDELILNEDRKSSMQSNQSDYAEASESIIDQFDDDRFREAANVVRKKSVRFQSPDVVKDIRLFTPGSSQEIEFYDADDENFGEKAIQDLIDDQMDYLKGKSDETNFDQDSSDTLVKQTDKLKNLTEEVELEYPPELVELMKKPFKSLSEKERSKLIKLKTKYDEKLKKLKEKQEAKLKKEMEKARKKAEEDEKKAEKARRKEEEKLRKQEEKNRKEEEKKLKKSKDDDDKKGKRKLSKDDAKSLNNETDLKIKIENEKLVKQDIENEANIQKVDLATKTDDQPQIRKQDYDLQDKESVLKDKEILKIEDDKLKANEIECDLIEKSEIKNDEAKEQIEEVKIQNNKIKDMKTEEEKIDLKLEKKLRTKKLSPKKKSQPIDKQEIVNENQVDSKIGFKKHLLEQIDNKNDDSCSLKESYSNKSSDNQDNLLESIPKLSPEAKLNNKLFKNSTSTEENATNIKLDNIPLIVIAQKDKSATLDDRLLRKSRSPKLTSVEQLDFHHLDNVGCLDSSIKNYFSNFERSDNLSNIQNTRTDVKYKERRSISPTPTSTRAHRTLDLPSVRLKRHTISSKREPPVYLDNLRSQLNTLSNAELSFFANQIKENQWKSSDLNQFELINKNLLNALHHNSELSVSTPCLSDLKKPYSPTFVPIYKPISSNFSINRHLSPKPIGSSLMPIRRSSPIQMSSLEIHFKTESMPSLNYRTSNVRPFLRTSLIRPSSIRSTYPHHQQFSYNQTGDVYYRETISQLKRIEQKLNNLKEQFDSTASLSIFNAKTSLNESRKRLLDKVPSYEYHCSINLVKDDTDVKPIVKREDKIDLSNDQSRTKLYFRIYRQLACNHIGSKDLTSKIQEHEDEFRAFCPPYVCVLCYYTVISIHYLIRQGHSMGEAIEMVKNKQNKEKEERWKHKPTILLESRLESRSRLNTPNYLPSYSRCSSPIRDRYSYSNNDVCHQATTHLNHQQHYSYERSHKAPRFDYRNEYLNFKSNLDQRSKSPNTFSEFPSSTVKSACHSLYHSSYRTNYSNKFQSEYMKNKFNGYPLKDVNFRKAEQALKLRNNRF